MHGNNNNSNNDPNNNRELTDEYPPVDQLHSGDGYRSTSLHLTIRYPETARMHSSSERNPSERQLHRTTRWVSRITPAATTAETTAIAGAMKHGPYSARTRTANSRYSLRSRGGTDGTLLN